MRIELPDSRYPAADDRLRFFEQWRLASARSADVQAVAFANRFPLRGGWGGGMYLTDQRERMIEVDLAARQRRYFATLGIPVVRGRGLETSDRTGSLPVAVVNAALCREILSGSRRRGTTAPPKRAGTLHHDRRRRRRRPARREGGPVRQACTCQLRRRRSIPCGLPILRSVRHTIRMRWSPSIQAAVLTIDRELPIGNVRTLSEVVGESLALRRFQVGLISVFAALALVLTVVGVYGVAACAAAQRTVEFGVRVALGATPSDILRLVLTQSAALVAGGLVVGIAGALALRGGWRASCSKVRPHDPATLGAVSLLLVAVAMVASYVPAVERRESIRPTRCDRNEAAGVRPPSDV